MSTTLENLILIRMANSLGSYLRQARERRGWRLDDVSRPIGRPSTWLSNLEVGKTKNLPEPEELRKIAAVLDLPMVDVLIAAGYLRTEDIEGRVEENDAVNGITPLMRGVTWNEDRLALLKAILRQWIELDRMKQ